jgi:four helix bundle protein
MGNREDSIVLKKAFDFALRIIQLNRELVAKHEFVLSKQVVRSGTSIGANINEALGGVSAKDFQHKMSIAFKEANETEYWLKLLKYSDTQNTDKLITDVVELRKILSSIIITSKSNNQTIKSQKPFLK